MVAPKNSLSRETLTPQQLARLRQIERAAGVTPGMSPEEREARLVALGRKFERPIWILAPIAAVSALIGSYFLYQSFQEQPNCPAPYTCSAFKNTPGME
jgi:type VI protein secretion system component VasF